MPMRKLRELHQEYKKIKEKLWKTGQEGGWYLISKFEYFEVLDKTFGKKPAIQSKVITESIAGIATVNRKISDNDESVISIERDLNYPGTSSTAMYYGKWWWWKKVK